MLWSKGGKSCMTPTPLMRMPVTVTLPPRCCEDMEQHTEKILVVFFNLVDRPIVGMKRRHHVR